MSIQIEQGNATERFVSKTFKKFGYWSYILPKKVNGQPCDVCAGKGGERTLMWLVDAKHVESSKVSFTFDRIEPNQISAMAYALNYAKISNLGFAIFFDRDKKLYWFSYQDFVKCQQLGMKSVNMNTLVSFDEVLANEDNY